LPQLGNLDPAQSGYWSIREAFVAIVLTNMPIVYPLFKRVFERGLSTAGRSGSGRGSGGSDTATADLLRSAPTRKGSDGPCAARHNNSNNNINAVRSEIGTSATRLPKAPTPVVPPKRNYSYNAWYEAWDMECGHRRSSAPAAPECHSCRGALAGVEPADDG
jgi:hypothetical protein